jgi:D-alanyl-D-alanine carboxypeptidase
MTPIMSAGTLSGMAVVAALAALGASGCASSRQATTEPPTIENPAYQRELRTVTSDGESGAAGIIASDAGTWKGAAGWADSHAKRRARPDDRFAIESTTKTFVATVVLQLVGEKRLTLRDPVQRRLPGLLPRRPRITIEQLLDHTSGLLTDFAFGDAPRHRAEQIARQGLLFKPGTSFNYSNADYVFLGLIVEKVTGRPLDRVVTDRIFRPLHLESTSYGTTRAPRMSPWLGPPELPARPVSGDGGIISTVDDLATFFRALLGGKLLSPELLSNMTHTIATPDPDLRVGLGIFRKRVSCGYAWGHGGDLTYSVNTAVTRDGSKAVITAQNNPSLGDGDIAERLYCS